MLCQIPVPTELQFAAWIACAGGVLWILNQGKKFISGFQEQPPPNQTYATKQEVAELKNEMRAQWERINDAIRSLGEEMKRDKTEILKAGEERITKVHERINVAITSVSELRGEMHARRMDM